MGTQCAWSPECLPWQTHRHQNSFLHTTLAYISKKVNISEVRGQLMRWNLKRSSSTSIDMLIVKIDASASLALLTCCAVATGENRISAHKLRSNLCNHCSNRALSLSSPSHHQLQSLSSAQRTQNSEKPTRHFFDGPGPVRNKHVALVSITAEGSRPTTTQNQQRSPPCF